MDDALEVLRQAVSRAPQAKQRGADVRLALRTLRFVGVPAAEIAYFWESCGADNEIGRSQNMNAALNGIVLRLGAQTGLAADDPIADVRWSPHNVQMKVATALGLMVVTCACTSPDDFVTPAKQCAQKQLSTVRTIDASSRQLVASRCEEQIRNWAKRGLEKAQGHAVDLGDVRTRQELQDRQRVVLRVLVPLKSDRPTM